MNISTTKRVLYALAAGILFFLITEGGVRIYLARYIHLYPYVMDDSSPEARLVTDQQFGWAWEGNVIFRGRTKTSLAKTSGVFRIITAGDSCCWGGLVLHDQTYSTYLEDLLTKHHGEGRIEVLNSGVPGYSLTQSFGFIRDKLIYFNPDLIVFYGTGEIDLHRGEQKGDGLLSMTNRLLFRSKTYLLLNEIIRSRKPIKLRDEPLYRSKILRMDSFLKTQGTRLMMVEYLSQSQNGSLVRGLTTKVDSYDVPVVETYNAFIQSGYPVQKLLIDTVHPSSLGHEIIAQRIFDEIEALKLISF